MADNPGIKWSDSSFIQQLWNSENIEMANVVGYLGTNNIKMLLSELKKFILENKNIGGMGSGDIATIDGAQTFTNKRLNSPNINGAIVSQNVTGNEISCLEGVTTNVKNQLDSLLQSIIALQTELDNLSIANTMMNYSKVISFSHTIAITASEIAPSNTIDPESISVDCYVKDNTDTKNPWIKCELDVSIYLEADGKLKHILIDKSGRNIPVLCQIFLIVIHYLGSF